jgi:hypothetical protein
MASEVENQGKRIQSSHITFTLRKGHCPAFNIHHTIIPQAQSVKYLGLQLDGRLTWKDRIAKKRKQINLSIKEINWLIGRKSHLYIENKILIYGAETCSQIYMYNYSIRNQFNEVL